MPTKDATKAITLLDPRSRWFDLGRASYGESVQRVRRMAEGGFGVAGDTSLQEYEDTWTVDPETGLPIRMRDLAAKRKARATAGPITDSAAPKVINRFTEGRSNPVLSSAADAAGDVVRTATKPIPALQSALDVYNKTNLVATGTGVAQADADLVAPQSPLDVAALVALDLGAGGVATNTVKKGLQTLSKVDGPVTGARFGAGLPSSSDDIMDAMAYMQKRLQQAQEAGGDAARMAELERLRGLNQVQLAADQATQKANQSLRWGNTAKEELAENADAMADASKNVRTENYGAGLPPVDVAQAAKDNLTLAQKIGLTLLDLPGVAVSTKASLTPPIGRQGLTRLLTRPSKAIEELGLSLKMSLDPQAYKAVEQTILNDEWIRLSDEAVPSGQLALDGGMGAVNKGFTWQDLGGAILKVGDDVPANLRPEELQGLATRSALGEAVQNFGPIKWSTAQQAAELNLHRTRWYSEVADKMWKIGIRDKNEYGRLVKFIEHQTQRGSLRTPGRVPYFFSLPAMSGRIQGLFDLVRYGVGGALTNPRALLQPGITQEAARVIAGYAALGTSMLALNEALGIGRIEYNDGLPTLVVGNQHYDPWGGANSIIKVATRTAQSIEEHAEAGTLWELPNAELEILQNFARNGLSPLIGRLVDIRAGEDFLRKPVTFEGEIKKGPFPGAGLIGEMFAPFVLEGLFETLKEGDITAAASGLAAESVSMGTQYYEDAWQDTDDSVKSLVQQGQLPATYLDKNGNPQPVRGYSDLSPLQKEQFDKANPELAQARIEAAREITQQRAQLQADFKAKQEQRDEQLLNSNPSEWRRQSGEAARELGLRIDQMYAAEGEFDKEPKTLLDVAQNEYHAAIEAATDQLGNVDWDSVDKAVAAMPKAKQDLLFESRLAGETPARQQYIRDLATLTPYFEQRDAAWEAIKASDPSLAQYKRFDDFRQAMIQEVHDQGIGWTEAASKVDSKLEKYSEAIGRQANIYLAENADALLPLLDKYDFYVPAKFKKYVRKVA